MDIQNTNTNTENNQPLPRRHVAVCVFPFGSHAPNILPLVKRLASSAPDVRFTFFNTSHSNATLFKTNAFPNIVPRATVEYHAPPHGNAGFDPEAAVGAFLRHTPADLRRGMAEAEADVGVKISCVISDAFLWFCGEIAEEKGVPWVTIWTSSAGTLSAHVHTDFLRSKFRELQGEDGQDEIIGDGISGFSNVRFGDLPYEVVAGNLESPFTIMAHQSGLSVPKATAVVINAFEKLLLTITNDLKSKMRLLCVGPFVLNSPPQSSDQYGCLPWLDKQEAKTVAFISFGTFAVPPKEELVALAQALEDTELPFLWSIKDSVKMNLPSSFINKISNDEMLGKFVPWAPQMDVLRHPSTGVFITHCGWNSIMESIVAGVPVICRPILGDQMFNKRCVESEWKFGIGLEGGVFTKSSATKALHQVLLSEEGKQMGEKVKKLKEVAEEDIKEGARSYENLNALIQLVTS